VIDLAVAEVSAREGVLDLDAGRPLPDVIDIAAGGVRALVRLAGRPVASVDLAGDADRVTAAELAAVIDAQAGMALADRLRTLGVAEAGPLATGGFGVDVPEPPAGVAEQMTVVVATRARPELLERCLQSILDCRPSPGAVVVVDNAPPDDRAAELVAARHGDDPRVHYVVEPRPGLGRAHQAALPLVGTELVAFTDDDVVVDPSWVGALAEAFAATGDVACVTGLIAPAELRTREQWWVELGAGFTKGYERRVRSIRDRVHESAMFPYDAGTFGSGANMAFRTADLLRVGGFDAALGTGTVSLGGDDLAAFHAVVAAGHDLVYEPAAVVFHRHHADRASLERQAYGYGAGLTAYLTAAAVADPRAALRMARRSVAGVAHVLHPSSPLNARRAADYPSRLVWRERAGMLAGPGRYARQRLADRRARS
jgi:GT2 family glycosyltransferase